MNRRHLLQLAAAAPLAAIPASAQIGTTIASIEVFRVKVNQLGDWLIVRLKTNHGHTGIGDASHSGDDAKAVELIRQFFDRLKGNSPFQVEPFRRTLMNDIVVNGQPGAAAYGAIEQAMYDLQGQILGVPVYALFGGVIHGQIRHYANINRATTKRTPEGFAQQAELAVKAGFDAVKLAPFDGMPRGNPEKSEAHTKLGIACVAAVRKAIGSERRLLVDAHSNFDVDRGLELAKSLEEYNLGWLEEATRSIEGLAEINKAAKMPTAGGELLFGVRGFLPYIAGKAVDIVMPDVKYCGGLYELKKIAAMAEGASLYCSPHSPASPVGNVAAAHVCATLPNFLILEVAFGEAPWRSQLLDPPEVFSKGSLMLPDAPGFGVKLNDAVVRKHAV
jgi:galactonate dehydratase